MGLFIDRLRKDQGDLILDQLDIIHDAIWLELDLLSVAIKLSTFISQIKVLFSTEDVNNIEKVISALEINDTTTAIHVLSQAIGSMHDVIYPEDFKVFKQQINEYEVKKKRQTFHIVKLT